MLGDRLAALRPLLLPVVLIVLALAAFNLRIANQMPDFEVYRAAGRRAIAAEPLYQVEPQHNQPFRFTDLPATAVAMAAMALITQETARVGWYALGCACLVVLLRWSVVTLPERRWSERSLIIVTLAVLARYYMQDLALGQSDLLACVVMLTGLGALQLEAPKVAACSLAVAVFLEPSAIIFLPWLIGAHGVKPGAVAIAALVAGLLLPATFYGWTGNLGELSSWWQAVSSADAHTGVGATNVSLISMWTTWTGPGTLAAVLTVGSVLLLLAVVATMWRQRQRVSEPDYTEFAFLMLILPLLSPHGLEYMVLLGTPAVVCVVDRWRELRTPWRFVSGTALAVMGLSLFDVIDRATSGGFLTWSVISICVLVVAATLAQIRLRALA